MLVNQINISELQDISELRNYYHSINLSETSCAISALGKLKTSDASRELIQLYYDCLWRKIKIEIIQALGNHDNQRSLEFLFDLALSDQDLSLSNLAIEALGNSQNILAARFIEELYKNGPKTKKPIATLALVKLTHVSMLDLFNSDLKLALENNDFTAAKNLIYALGELRSHKSLDQLKLIVIGAYPKEIQLSAVTSIGKVSRHLNDLDMYADKYRYDAFEFQIFQHAQNQLIFRSEWKLEDYLNKLFQMPTYHKNLPLELNSFDAADVLSGLEIFYNSENISKIAKTLSLLNFKNINDWYDLFFKSAQPVKLIDSDIESIGLSLAHHQSEIAISVINKLYDFSPNTAYKTAVTALSNADKYFKDMITSDTYKNANDSFKINILNHLVDFLNVNKFDTKLFTSMSKFLENELVIEISTDVKTRLIRVLGQCRLPQNKIFIILKSFMKEVDLKNLNLLKSILFYLEYNPSHQTAVFLNDNYRFLENIKELSLNLLRALIAQDPDQFKLIDLKNLIQDSLNPKINADLTILCLKYLSKINAKVYKNDILKMLKHENNSVVLNAIIALKTIPDDDIPDLLQSLLYSKSESIKGRALDTILCNPSLRSKRLATDFLKDNLSSLDCVEKIIRHLNLNVTQLKSDYFLNSITNIIKNNSSHQLIDQFINLQMNLKNEITDSQFKNFPSAADLIAIDKDIISKLPRFNEYDESIKASLRSAEVPFNKPELFDQFVDKSVCILGFTKAIDIFLEKQFGKKILVPKLESRLHEFQNVIHMARLNEDYPDSHSVLKMLSLEKYFSAQSLPVHKMTLIGKGILNSKIIQDQFKIIDGLRAWGITFLLFGRKSESLAKPLFNAHLDEAQIIDLAKKLMWLQDLRNPAAHRLTMTKLEEIKEIRNQSYQILSLLEKTFM